MIKLTNKIFERLIHELNFDIVKGREIISLIEEEMNDYESDLEFNILDLLYELEEVLEEKEIETAKEIINKMFYKLNK